MAFSMKKFFTVASTALAITSNLASAAIADNHTEKPEKKPTRALTTQSPEIIQACPQLEEVELVTVAISDIPAIPTNITNAHHSGAITSEEDWNNVKPAWVRLSTLFGQAQSTDAFHISINSTGGFSQIAQIMAESMLFSEGTIYTEGKNVASSAMLKILISGTKGHRYVQHDSFMENHAAGYFYYDENNQPTDGPYYASDYSANSTIYKNLDEFNAWSRGLFIMQSTTNILAECSITLNQDYVNINMFPEDMLKLGLTDYVVNYEAGTAVMRAQSPSP